MAGFRYGDHVRVLWEDSLWWQGSILGVFYALDLVLVLWDSEDTCSLVGTKNIRLVSSEDHLLHIIPLRSKFVFSGGYRCERSQDVLAALRRDFEGLSSEGSGSFPEVNVAHALSLRFFQDEGVHVDHSQSGEDDACFQRVSSHPDFAGLVHKIIDILHQYDFVFVFCKSGKHRSVALSRAVREALAETYAVQSVHIRSSTEALLRDATKAATLLIVQ